MRAVIYTRVSTAEQVDGYSLDAQRDVCQAFCTHRNWHVIRVYEDAGISARTDDRPAFQQMIADGDYDVIVCHKLDRFSRSLLDVMTYLSKLNERGITFASATEDFDFSTPFGKVVLAMLAAFAQWYLDNLSAEVAKAAAQRHQEGHWLGNLAFGYTTPRRLRELLQTDITPELYEQVTALLAKHANAIDTAAIPCPLTAPGVKLAFELYASGKSYEQVADALNAAGYRSNANRSTPNLFNLHTVRDLLQNRFYLGEIARAQHNVHTTKKARRAARQWKLGAHEPIITPELFDRVQTRRRMRTRQPTNNQANQYPLSGLLFDRHGVRWHGSSTKGRAPRYVRSHYEARRANAPQLYVRSVRASELEMQIEQILSYIAVPEDAIDDAIRIMRKSVAAPSHSTATDVPAKQERLKSLYIEGLISKREFNERWHQLASPLMIQQAFNVDDAIELLRQLSDGSKIWRVAQSEERVELVRLLFNQLVLDVVDEEIKIVEVQPAPLLCHILDNLSRVNWGWWDSNPIYTYIPAAKVIGRRHNIAPSESANSSTSNNY